MRLLLLILCFPLYALGQNTITLPEILNYSKQTYNAGTQNWGIHQDSRGLLYVANNEGMLRYDGAFWSIYPLPNRTNVRSVYVANDQQIFVGGQDELGFFKPDASGRLQYVSIVAEVPLQERSFGDVWDIVALGKSIFFRTNKYIFKYTAGKITSFKAGTVWSFLGTCNEQLYAHDYETGLFRFENGGFATLTGKSKLPFNDMVTGILLHPSGTLLVTTLKNGVFSWQPSGNITPYSFLSNEILKNDRIYSAIPLKEQRYAFATNNNGVYITDAAGNILQQFNRTEGLQNNNILSIFEDAQQNLWLGLDNGIDFIAFNSAIKQINPNRQNGSGYNAMVFNNQLYAGTSNGLYTVPLEPTNDISYSKGNFTLVNNTKGQVWNISFVNGQLLMGHNDGAFVLNGNNATPLINNTGYWNFIPLDQQGNIVAGNYNGLQLLSFNNGKLSNSTPIDGFAESSRFVAVDADKDIWVSHPYHGVFLLTVKDNYRIQKLGTNQGLPSNLGNHIYLIRGEVVVATTAGVYIYRKDEQQFKPHPLYQSLLGKSNIRYLKEDGDGNIWLVQDKSLGVIDMSDAKGKLIFFPELANKILSGFEHVYPKDESNIFVAADKGFFHINYKKYKSQVTTPKVVISSVHVVSDTDSILFGGYTYVNDAAPIQLRRNNFSVLRFAYAAPVYAYAQSLMYSYRLQGFDDQWSSWDKRTEKEFTNLPAGKYTFEVKVKNNLGIESAVASYSFTVLPPWYASVVARIIYALLFMGILYAWYLWQERKLQQQQQQHEADQQRIQYIHELERKKDAAEIIELQNQKLEAEIGFKNAELAANAMHLVKKAELLTNIKTELLQVMKGVDNEKTVEALRKLMKNVSDDEHIDKEWESFTKHFDQVHSNFSVVLKEKHPTLTSNELKLCAYLRMNLSTKEIAQLLNISVRGVEISRYRLRKKLQLSTEVSLFDYLSGV